MLIFKSFTPRLGYAEAKLKIYVLVSQSPMLVLESEITIIMPGHQDSTLTSMDTNLDPGTEVLGSSMGIGDPSSSAKDLGTTFVSQGLGA